MTNVEATCEVQQRRAVEAMEAESGRLSSPTARAPGFMGVVRGPYDVFEFME